MVREATLRLGVDARGAKQSLDEFRRSSEQVNVTVQQTTVSTDRLEKKLDLLTVVTRQNARNTAFMANALARQTQESTRATVATERQTTAMAKQQTVGQKLGIVFGELVTKTAATGGAFLAADFLARVAGATSLMDGLNRVINTLADSFRNAFIQADSFAEAVIKASKAKPLSDQELAALFAGTSNRGKVAGAVFPGTLTPINLPQSALENQALAGGVAKILAEFEEDLLATRAAVGRITARGNYDESVQALSRGKQFEGFLAERAQQEIDRLVSFYSGLEEQGKATQAFLKDFNEQTAKATKAGQEWTAAMRSTTNRIQAQSPFAYIGAQAVIGAAQAGQTYSNAQFYANAGTAGSGGGGLPGGGFTQAIVANSAAYAGQLAVIIERQREAEQSGERMGQAIASSFEDAIFNARSLEEGLELVARAAIRAAFSEVVTANLASSIAGVFSAKGNVFSGGDVVPFANGGVLSSPIAFPLNGGKVGVAGEAGPEAIMPLGRNAKGELGVKGGGSTIVFNISTPDVAGFNRSRRQIAQDMRRALKG